MAPLSSSTTLPIRWVSMAKREDSDAAQHETFPGTGPRKGPQADSGIHAVEQMVDAAIDQLARQYRERGVAHSTVEHESQRVARGSEAAQRAIAREQASSAIVPEGAGSQERRLRWRGLDVSDEFHQYAQRIARGEKLPPYAGQVLAQPDPRFPWQPGARSRPSRRSRVVLYTLCASSVFVAFGIVWAAALRIENRVRPLPSEIVSQVKVSPKEVVAPPAADLPRAEAAAAPIPEAVGSPVEPVAFTAPNSVGMTARAPQAQPRIFPPRPTPNATPVPPKAPSPEQGDLRAALGELLRPNVPEADPTATASEPPGAPVANAPSGAASVAPPRLAPAPPAPPAPAAEHAGVAARKGPGSESSAKGSLLVETPSF